MLSNPPYGKSWKSDLERMGGKDGIKDPRFVIEHAGDPEYSLVTRSSDGQMLFLANMLSKMKHGTPLGSRIAEVHNGSSLFTGDAGQGESNIRRWIIENDWLEAIVALPLNMFYNTGIATYIWVLTNRKPEHRKGKVQLIDATQWFKPLRKNLGKKNCELSDEDIQRICDTFLAFKETEQSKIFPNAAFGYWKVTVERPLRLKGIDPERVYSPKEIKALKETAERAEDAPPVIRKIHKKGTAPIRCAGCSRPRSTASLPSSSTSPTPTCATPSRCRCWKKAASRRSCAARCCPTRRTPGTSRTASRPATRSASRATSTSRSRCGRSRRSAPTSWRWRRRPRACSAKFIGVREEVDDDRAAKVYLTRAGKGAKTRTSPLRTTSAIIGFQEVPSLEAAKDYDAVFKIVEDSLPGAKPRAIGNIAGQLWAFALAMKEGDIVVLPRKLTSQIAIWPRDRTVSISKVGGGLRHTRPVEWVRPDVPRTAFEQDLLYSFGAFMTVCNISRNDAERRVAAVLKESRTQAVVVARQAYEEAPVPNGQSAARCQTWRSSRMTRSLRTSRPLRRTRAGWARGRRAAPMAG